MKIFKHYNQDAKEPCIICQTKDDKECVLIGIVGTEEGHNMQAIAIHLDCLDLYYYPTMKIIAMKTGEVTEEEK